LPLYAYLCTQCGHRFEKIQGFGDESEKECPQCHGALERPLTVPALQFKGAGWYVNDYAGKTESAASVKSSQSTENLPSQAAKVAAAASEPPASPAAAAE
jgi:putative FmdB family regulatory protein